MSNDWLIVEIVFASNSLLPCDDSILVISPDTFDKFSLITFSSTPELLAILLGILKLYSLFVSGVSSTVKYLADPEHNFMNVSLIPGANTLSPLSETSIGIGEYPKVLVYSISSTPPFLALFFGSELNLLPPSTLKSFVPKPEALKFANSHLYSCSAVGRVCPDSHMPAPFLFPQLENPNEYRKGLYLIFSPTGNSSVSLSGSGLEPGISAPAGKDPHENLPSSTNLANSGFITLSFIKEPSSSLIFAFLVLGTTFLLIVSTDNDETYFFISSLKIDVNESNVASND